MRLARFVARTRGMRNKYKMLVENIRRKDPLGRSRRTWQDTIKLDLKEWGVWNAFNWLRIGSSGGLM